MTGVAIVGLGGVYPAAATAEALWQNVLARVDAASEPPPGRWLLGPDAAFDPAVARPDRVYSRRACFVEPFALDPEGLDVDPALLAGLDPLFHLALYAGRQAWQAGVTAGLDRSRVGVILGSIALPTEKASELARLYLGEAHFGRPAAGGPHPLNAEVVGLPAGLLARALGLGGPAYTLDAACASSLYAVKLAADELLAGRADAMLAGGVSRPDSLYTQMGFAQLRALSPTGRCSPFDARGDGLVVGEGAGVFLLKRTADAVRDGDDVLGVIAGVGLSNDIGGGLLAPASEGQLRALRAAYAQAGWRPDEVGLIECHATGTPVGDAVEARSLHALWEGLPRRAGQCVLGSVKSTVGHLLTGAGAAALTKVLFALRDGVLPPTANFERAAAGLGLDGSPFRVLREPEPWPRRGGAPRRAAVSAFGFGGVNAHLLIEEGPGKNPSPQPPPRKLLLPSPSASGGEGLGVRGVALQLGGGVTGDGIAVVALAGRFAALGSLADLRQAVLGTPPPAAPGEAVPGYFFEEIRVSADRFRIPPREIEEMLPQQALVLQVASEALAAAGWDGQPWPRAGVYVGVALDLNTTQFSFRWSLLRDEPGRADEAGPALSANRTMGALASIAASRVAREHRLGGPSFTLSGGETSGLHALHAACEALRRGEIDQAVVAAVDLPGDLRSVRARDAVRRWSRAGKARPFDPDADGGVVGEGAVAVVLKRLADAVRDGDAVHAVVVGVGVAGGGQVGSPSPAASAEAVRRACQEAGVGPEAVAFVEAHGSADPGEDHVESEALAQVVPGAAWGSVKALVGHTGAAAGLASLVQACLCLREQVLPGLPHNRQGPGGAGWSRLARPWLRDREGGPRLAGVHSMGPDGGCAHVLLREGPAADLPPRLDPGGEALFAVEGRDVAELLAGLRKLSGEAGGDDLTGLARRWWAANGPSHTDARGLAVALVARDAAELRVLIESATAHLRQRPDEPLMGGSAGPHRDRVFYTPAPLGPAGEVAFVYPGSGNDFPGMGRELALRWPAVLAGQDAENRTLRRQYLPEKFWCDPPAGATVQDRIFAQVAVGSLVSDLLGSFGVRPAAALGYSLGESAALFALRAWRDRDGMLGAMHGSTLFVSDLTGRCDAARAAWGVPAGQEVRWQTCVVARPPAEVRRALAGLGRVYLQIINTPAECVVGGDPAAVAQLLGRLNAPLVPVPETTTMHCEVVGVVAGAYRALHRLETTPPAGVRFYSTALGRAYPLSADAAADAILRQASETVDFPAVVEAAYRDGVRLFVEVGPGGSCARMIGAVLGDRPHRARSACVPGADGLAPLWRTLAVLLAERVRVDLAAVYGPAPPTPAAGGRTVVVLVRAPESRERERPELRASRERERPEDDRRPRVAAAPAPGSEDSTRGFTAWPPPPGVPGRSCLEPPGGDRVVKPRVESSEPGEQPWAEPHTPGSPALAASSAVLEARAHAHGAYLRVSDALRHTFAETLAFQGQLFESLLRTPHAPPARPRVALDRAQCLEFAVGSVARVLGERFAEVDRFPTRVRLPDEPLMLVDRVLTIEGEPGSLTRGRVTTEHDVRPGAWYLDAGRIPTCVAVEAGQADLFLSGYLGIDFRTRGLAVYRLLDAVVTFHCGLPGPGEVIHYDIHIDQFFRQGDTHLFRFRFVGTVGGEPLLTMTDGCAGFFTAETLAAGKGVVHTPLQRAPRAGVVPADEDFLPPMHEESYTEPQVDALRQGDLAGCFGPAFAGLPLARPLTLPGGRMRLVHRVTRLEPRGGRFGVGRIVAEADIHPDDWFLACHFTDDQVMPGTLMYECCLHTLRVFLMRLGWVGEEAQTACEPVVGVASRLKCRGQVTAGTRTVTYEVTLKERGYRPEPYALVDALMYADGKPVVDITDMSVRMTGLTREKVAAVWAGRTPSANPKATPLTPNPCSPPVVEGEGGRSALAPPLRFGEGAGGEGLGGKQAPLFDRDRILAFAVGKPSEAFGEPYRVFDQQRVIARLPGPPYQFLDRIVALDAQPWRMVAGGRVEAEYDVPADAWYFASARAPVMPFAVLLEAALQPCGWLAAYLGSALTSPTDLRFRNLGGTATLLRAVTPDAGTLVTRVAITRVSTSAGMILQDFTFDLHDDHGPVYAGTTSFGFFSPAALAQQVGLRDGGWVQAGDQPGLSFAYPPQPPYPDAMLGMIDAVDVLADDGGPAGLGLVQGQKTVRPGEWFFKAHFHQDPVCPGSLGLESLLQLLQLLAGRRWGDAPGCRFKANVGGTHRWTYRGQVVPSNRVVTVQAVVTARDDDRQELTADGLLRVDGLSIYRMNDFRLRREE
jgi:acyl transferase domain-containing protein/3-hydroxymyristoyl/3-hydroxydecanoyl-(acyl carrier protein) dehydratase